MELMAFLGGILVGIAGTLYCLNEMTKTDEERIDELLEDKKPIDIP